MTRSEQIKSLCMRVIASSFFIFCLNACYVGPSMYCVLLICWDGEDDDDDYEYDANAYAYSNGSGFTPSSVSYDYNNWLVSTKDETSNKTNRGLKIAKSQATFISNTTGEGGNLLVDIDANAASFACDVKLHALIDGADVVSMPLMPVAGSSNVIAKSMGTGCLSANASEGSNKGVAVFQLDQAPKSITLTEFELRPDEILPNNKVTVGDSNVTYLFSQYSKTIKVWVSASPNSPPVNPLALEGFLTGTPFDFLKNQLFAELEIDSTIKNLERDDTSNSISYELGYKYVPTSVAYYSLNFQITSLRDADP